MAPPSGGARMEAHGDEPEQYEDRTLDDRSDADEASLGACVGEAEGRTRGSPFPSPDAPRTDPSPTPAPGGRRASRPPPPAPPPPRPPRCQTALDTQTRPQGDKPPRARQGDTGRGHRGGPARAGAGTSRERRRTNTQRARSADPKGQWSEPAERTDHMEWRSSRLRKGTPGQDNPQHAPREV